MKYTWTYYRIWEPLHGFIELSARLYAFCVIVGIVRLGHTVTPVTLQRKKVSSAESYCV